MKKLSILFLSLYIAVNSFGIELPWIDARDYHDGNYNNYDGAAITGALNAAGTSEKTIFLAAGIWYIQHSITIPANITLKFEHGAILKISAAKTFTINGNIESSVRQIFSGAGMVKLGSLIKEAYPQWWGLVGTPNDTNVCQAALDSGAKTIRFLPGTYNILPHDPQIIEYGGLKPRSNTILIFEQGSKLKAITNNRDHYSVINVNGVKNVKIYGPTIEGERKTHTGTTGEWGMGILIQGQSKQIVIKDANVYDCWGDGICIGGGTQEDIYVENSIFNNSRRNGCSVTNAKNVLFKKCTFANSNGTSPQKGVDIEADYPTDYIQNIIFEDCYSYGNLATGFSLAKDGPLTNPLSVTFRNCTSTGDNAGFGIDQGPSDTNGGMVYITNCYCINPRGNGFYSGSANLPVTINGLTVINPNQDGLDETWARYASGLTVLMMDDSRYAGNVTARNVRVESTDGKAVKALCLHHFSSNPNSGIQNIDIELTTNMPNNKRFFKADSAASFVGYCKVLFPDNPVFNATTNVSSTEAVKYIGQTITNQGAAGNITVVLTAPGSVSNGSEFTFEVKSPYRITLSMTGYPLRPGNKTSYYSTTVGDRLKVRADGSNWYIVEQIGTWQ